MPPRGWTTPEEFAFLQGKIAEYVTKKAEGRLWKFWPVFFEEWFQHFSEEARMGLAGVVKNKEQTEAVGAALLKRKSQLVSWLRYHSSKVNASPVVGVREDSLANDLFKKHAPRRRAHRPIELFQKRNSALIDTALDAAGFFEMNEAHAAATLAGWAEESAEEQKVRMKAAQVERMTVRTRVVDELFSEVTEDEMRCIEELIEEEKRVLALVSKGGKKGLKEQERQDAEDAAREPTPDEYQMAIDESPEVMARVHRALAKKTGWYGITIYGGPNPRFGGGLSMKTVCFGRTPAGNDFEAAHGSFDDSISKHFQAFLKRSFPAEIRRARAAQQLEETVDATLPALDGLFRMPNEPVAPAAVREKPKRVRKKKAKNAVTTTPPAAPASDSSPATPAAPAPISSAETPAAATPPVPLSPGSLPNSSPRSDDSAYALQTPSDDPFADNGDNVFNTDLDMHSDEGTSHWPPGMGPPSSPATAEANANAERGGSHGATYVHARLPSPPIDPLLLITHPTGPNGPRPAWKGTANALSGVPSSPTPRPSLYGLINRFHHIMGDPPVAAAIGCPSSFHSTMNSAPVASVLSNLVMNTAPTPASVRPPTHTERNSRPALVSPNSPARISRISSTTVGAARTAQLEAGGSTESPSEPAAPAPFMISSRPMANDPNAAKAKAAPAAEKKTGTGRGGGRKQVIATEGATKEAAAKMAAKAATKKGAKGGRKTRAGTGAAAAGALDDATNLDAGEAPAPAGTDTPPPASISVPAAAPTLIYTTTNNCARNARAARKLEAEKKAKELAGRKERARVYNPDGPTDLVILPGPGRVQRSRKVTKNFDGSAVEVPKKITRAEQLAKKNQASENALLARTGKKRVAEDEVPIATRASKR
ncbi:hypothetical protein C8R43DRAFT_1125166 [Mycena crocata]|nr:hypothetical protein C8R43DRAFT_1125166 [Mycena crocata]